MFSFSFNLLQNFPQDWKIVINGHDIPCSRVNAEIISKRIFEYNSLHKPNLDKKKEDDFFNIAIPEFENPFLCSELDYQYFVNIFNLNPIRISLTNKEVLKIFAKELEIKEISDLIEMFEQSYELIVNDKILKIQKEITDEMINITDENFEQLIEHLTKIDDEISEFNENENNKNNNSESLDLIINNDFIYSIVLTTCSIRSNKIELLMKFLKRLEEETKRNQFEYFKDMILHEVKENSYYNCNEIKFIIRHLYNIHELDEDSIIKVVGHIDPKDGKPYLGSFDTLLFDKIDNYEKLIKPSYIVRYTQNDDEICIEYNKDELLEYAKTGYSTNKIYQAIKNDDIESFTQLLAEKGTSEINFNDTIQTLTFERNSCLFKYNSYINYIDFCAFYGSEKIFNYIIMNGDKIKCITENTVILAFSGGNASIIHKCSESLESNHVLLLKCLLYTIKYNQNEVFEWLIETYDQIEMELFHKYRNDENSESVFESLFLENAIKFNNFEALFYLFSRGIDYTPLFTLSLLFNNYYLAHLSTKLQYNCEFPPNKIKKAIKSPFAYQHNKESPLFIAIFKNRMDFVKLMINQDDFNPQIKYQSTSPLYFAVAYNKLEIVKYFLKLNIFPINSKVNDILLFEYTIKQNKFEIAENLIQQPQIITIGQSSLELVEIPKYKYINPPSSVNITSNYYYLNPEKKVFAKNLIQFFLKTVDNNEYIENIKCVIVSKKAGFFGCLLAKYADENDFVNFFNKFKLDINVIDRNSVLNLHYFIN